MVVLGHVVVEDSRGSGHVWVAILVRGLWLNSLQDTVLSNK